MAAAYFDDNAVMDIAEAAGSGRAALVTAYEVFGGGLAAAKALLPAAARPFLGLVQNVQGPLADGAVWVALKDGMANKISHFRVSDCLDIILHKIYRQAT